ncbi:MAG: hypothetical protein H6996_08470 [Moraxellaceae bacterium]|nr:hypothetical protein [Moraxellaceae bacterium]
MAIARDTSCNKVCMCMLYEKEAKNTSYSVFMICGAQDKRFLKKMQVGKRPKDEGLNSHKQIRKQRIQCLTQR